MMHPRLLLVLVGFGLGLVPNWRTWLQANASPLPHEHALAPAVPEAMVVTPGASTPPKEPVPILVVQKASWHEAHRHVVIQNRAITPSAPPSAQEPPHPGRFQGPLFTLLSSMDEADVAHFITSHTGLTAADIHPRYTIRETAQALYDLTRGSYDEKAGTAPEFGFRLDNHNRIISPLRQFHLTTHPLYKHKIYASFNLGSIKADSVLVRLHRLGDTYPLALYKQSVNTNQAMQAVWFMPESGWSDGEYLVHVFNVKEDFNPVVSGSFMVKMDHAVAKTSP